MSFSTCTPPVPASSLVSCSYLFSFTVYPYLFTPAFKVFFRKIGRIFLTFGYICPPQRGRFLCLHTLYKVRRKKLLDFGGNWFYFGITGFWGVAAPAGGGRLKASRFSWGITFSQFFPISPLGLAQTLKGERVFF